MRTRDYKKKEGRISKKEKRHFKIKCENNMGEKKLKLKFDRRAYRKGKKWITEKR